MKIGDIILIPFPFAELTNKIADLGKLSPKELSEFKNILAEIIK
jgi:hypothetical protein